MFTGLIEEVGVVERVERKGDLLVMTVKSSFDDVKPKDSVNVDGACLTVVEVGKGRFVVEVSPETQGKTTIGGIVSSARVNLERAMKLGDRLGGHFVLGHVDGVGKIVRRSEEGEFLILEVEVAEELARFLVPKGSVAVNGVSLTVNEVFKNRFKIGIIPYTLKVTNLRDLKAGDLVNIETDVIGKYIAMFLENRGATGGVTEELLERSGFVRSKR